MIYDYLSLNYNNSDSSNIDIFPTDGSSACRL